MMHQRVRAFTGRWLAAAVLLLAGAGWAHADIYSTFGTDPNPSDTYSYSKSHMVSQGSQVGFSFFLEGQKSYALNSIGLEMALGLSDVEDDESEGADNEWTEGQLAVSLRTDNGGMPGDVLTTFSFNSISNKVADTLIGTPGPFVGTGTLVPDNTYWLVASAPTDVKIAWYWPNPAAFGQAGYFYDNSWDIPVDPDYLSAFRLTAVVPVPGAVLLGVLGLGYSGWRLRRRRA